MLIRSSDIRTCFPALVNDVLLFGQYLIYFPYFLVYVHRRKKYLMENDANVDYLLLLWLPRFVWFFFFLFTVVFVAYIIAPRTDVWLIPILDTLGMSYLIYCSIRYVPSVQARPHREEAPGNVEPKQAPVSVLTSEQMSEICRRASTYLQENKAFLDLDITLASLAKDTGIPSRNLSRAINTYLKCNFFEYINTMRVEYAKQRLLELSTSEYNIDSIYEECGFRSRSTFFLVFKKIVGKSPAAWLTENTD